MPAELPSGFRAAKLRITLEQSSGEGLDSGLDPWARFLSGVVKGVIARRSRPESEEDPGSPSIFFLADPPVDLPAEIVRRTFVQGEVAVDGHVWFMNEEARRGNGRAHDLDADGLMSLAADHPELSTVPTLVLIPAAEHGPLVFFREGLAKERLRRDYELLELATCTPDRINAAIDLLHQDVLEAPQGMNGSFRAWQDGENWKPVRQAEQRIQAQVRATLVNAVPGVHATEENMGKSGRHDIGLVSTVNGTHKYHGLLELKVLRKSAKSNAILKKGVEQAFNYAEDVSSDWSELAVFDMSDNSPEKDVFAAVAADAAALGVHTRRWFMYSTLNRLRAARAARALSVED